MAASWPPGHGPWNPGPCALCRCQEVGHAHVLLFLATATDGIRVRPPAGGQFRVYQCMQCDPWRTWIEGLPHIPFSLTHAYGEAPRLAFADFAISSDFGILPAGHPLAP